MQEVDHSDAHEDLDDLDLSAISARKGVLDVGLDGVVRKVDLDVDPQFIEAGLKVIGDILERAKEHDISDIQIQADSNIRIETTDGLQIFGENRLNSRDVVGILLALAYNRRTDIALSKKLQDLERQSMQRALETNREVNFGCEGGVASEFERRGDYVLPAGRFRVCGYFCSSGLGITCRILKDSIISLEETGLPDDVIRSLRTLVMKKSGLGLITGATGSGKTTTIAALLQWVHMNSNKAIFTMEDPIEYRFRDSVSIRGQQEKPLEGMIVQQEVGRDILSYRQGVESVLRKAPKIILVGEIRDEETLTQCFRAAQTGHLVLATLHTRSAVETLGRILGLSKKEKPEAILASLSEHLLFILSQGLLPPLSMGAGKRVLAIEYMQVQDSQDKSSIKQYSEHPAKVTELLNKPHNTSWERYLDDLRDSKRISQETHESSSMKIAKDPK